MSRITINSNLPALTAQRNLQRTTASLQKSLERLGSGLRINHASDDSAGLAVASLLKSDSRVYTQAIRNVNDGLGLLNIAEGALGQLSNLAIRLNELAEQSANGIYGSSQRRGIQLESNSLVDEFNRIIQTTNFNGLNLIDDSLTNLQVQAGYGNTARGGSLALGIGSELDRTVGTGSFARTDQINFAGVTAGGDPPTAVVDFNGDGILDVLTATSDGLNGYVTINRGNGDGSFTSVQNYNTMMGDLAALAVGDFNGDGRMDAALRDGLGNAVEVAWGSATGTLASSSTVAIGGLGGGLTAGDFNGDGKTDLISNTSTGIKLIRVSSGTTLTQSSISSVQAVSTAGGDLNNDGILDLAYTTTAGVNVRLGTGGGAFANATAYATGYTSNNPLTIADINLDGFSDIVVGLGANGIGSFLGIGNGSLDSVKVTAGKAVGVDYTPKLAIGDVNGDGLLDVVAENELMVGGNDGRFTATAINTFNGINPAGLGDFNRDGVLDAIVNINDTDGAYVFIGNTTNATTIARLDLTSATQARNSLTTIRSVINRITSELGSIGASQSRLGVAASTLTQARENYDGASSRITDVDVSEESSNLVRSRILQQAGASVLAQANQQPALVLTLLARR